MTRRNKKSRDLEKQNVVIPDVIEEELWSLSDWMEKHWRTVAIALGSVSLGWAALGIYQIVSASAEQGRAEQTATVFEKAATPVLPPPEPSSDAPEAPPKRDFATFDTDKQRAEAIVTADKAQATSNPVIAVVVGGAKATLADRDGQIKALDAALAAAKGSALELPLHEQKATALHALGKTAEAAAEYAEVAKLAPTDFTKALAKLRTGDLYNPNAGSKAPDPAKAKAAYEEAAKAAKPGGKDPPAGALAFVLADANGKLARL